MTAEEAAGRWGVSVRRVRNYCAGGFVAGALRSGGRWRIPEDAAKPCRSRAASAPRAALLEALRREKAAGISGGIYHKVQIGAYVQLQPHRGRKPDARPDALYIRDRHDSRGGRGAARGRRRGDGESLPLRRYDYRTGPPSAERGFYQKASPRPSKTAPRTAGAAGSPRVATRGCQTKSAGSRPCRRRRPPSGCGELLASYEKVRERELDDLLDFSLPLRAHPPVSRTATAESGA